MAQEIKFLVTLAPEGAKRFAKGHTPYPWDYYLRDESGEGLGNAEHPVVGEATVIMPSVEACRDLALAKLKQLLEEVRADNHKREQAVQTEIQNLLALPAPDQETVEDDIPF